VASGLGPVARALWALVSVERGSAPGSAPVERGSAPLSVSVERGSALVSVSVLVPVEW
jgi:hypothetical protein